MQQSPKNTTNLLRVGVLMGGKSLEREVSFNSGRTICDHLDTSRYEPIALFQTEKNKLYILPWHFLHRGKTTDFVHRLATEAEHISWDDLKNTVDFIYIAQHGKFAEDGTLQGFLEVLGIPYLGAKVFASALAIDKQTQKKFLNKNSIDTPNGVLIQPHDIPTFSQEPKKLQTLLEHNKLSYPLIVKPHKEGSSLGVYCAQNQQELLEHIQTASSLYQKPQAVLVEERLVGMEFSCITITDHNKNKLIALPPTEIIPENQQIVFDYDQKYMPGRATKHTPARCTQKELETIQQTCIKTMETLDITNCARIDGFLLADGTIKIIDTNTISGMTPTSFTFLQAAEHNMSHTDFINHLIETELHEYGMLEAILKKEKKQKKSMKQEKKIRVGVMLGGASNEREISLESGRNIVYKLSPQKYDVTPLFVSSKQELFTINQRQLVRNATYEIEESLTPEQNIPWNDLPNHFDFIFLGLHGGHGENGSIQGTLEMLGLPYNGSGVLASSMCMDKYKTNQYLASCGFDIAQQKLIAKKDWLKNQKTIIENYTQFPAIVKPHDDGCSVMVQKVHNSQELATAIETLFAGNKDYALIEEYITAMELTVGVIGNKQAYALPPSQAVATQDILSIEEKFLPGAGENQTPAPLPQKALNLVRKTMEQVYTAVGCTGYARIDCFYQNEQQSPTGKERVLIIEINTLPGMTPATCIFHQAAEIGMKPMEFVDLIVELGLEEHAQKDISKHWSIVTTPKNIRKSL